MFMDIKVFFYLDSFLNLRLYFILKNFKITVYKKKKTEVNFLIKITVITQKAGRLS